MKLEANIYLHNEKIGALVSNGVSCQISLSQSYKENTRRNTLSLSIISMIKDRLDLFESPMAPLPPFIQSMLPEGLLREYLIEQSGMVIDENSFEADAYLLKAVGQDLPGAIEILDVNTEGVNDEFNKEIVEPDPKAKARFSLSGVQKKFSLKRRGNKFFIPVKSEGGDYIIKPQPKNGRLPNLAVNEYFHMRLAGQCGLEIPDIGLIGPEELGDLDEGKQGMPVSFYIQRFDRSDYGKIHMEELHQTLRLEGHISDKSKYEDFTFAEVLGFLSAVDHKYDSNLLDGYVKELCFSLVIGNSDFHLKNSAIIYPNKVKPLKAPSYDLLNTEFYDYEEMPLSLGLKQGGDIKYISEFDEEVFDRLMTQIKHPELKGCLTQMRSLVSFHYMRVLNEDSFMSKFCPPQFKQRLTDNYEQRFSTLNENNA